MRAALPASLLSIAFVVCAAQARGDATLRWTGCSEPQPLFGIEPYTAGPHTLTVTVDGNLGPTAWSGFEATIVVLDRCSSDGAFIPQAWRFDAGGCNAGAMSFTRPASYGGCPGLGAVTTSDAVTTTVFEESVGREGFLARHPAIEIHIKQEFSRVWLTEPRYVATQIVFDMTNTVAGADPNGAACGCGSTPREILLTSASLIGDDGTLGLSVQNQMSVSWADADWCVIDGPKHPTSNWGADPACLTTATHARTWGSIKAQYR